MPRINLLPWRDQARRHRQRRFIQITALVTLTGLLLVIGASQLIAQQTQQQEQRNALITQRMQAHHQAIRTVASLRASQAQHLSWLDTLQALQRERGLTVEILAALAEATNGQQYLTRVERSGNLLRLEGATKSSQQISELMHSLVRFDCFNAPSLTEVGSKDSGLKRFQLTLTLTDNRKINPQEPSS